MAAFAAPYHPATLHQASFSTSHEPSYPSHRLSMASSSSFPPSFTFSSIISHRPLAVSSISASFPSRSPFHDSTTFVARNDGAAVVGDPEAEFKRQLCARSETSTQSAIPLVFGHDRGAESSSTIPGLSGEDAQADEDESLIEGDGNFDPQDGERMNRVCDRLIEVFTIEKNKTEDWRRLLAFSHEWSKIRPYFFKRCKSKAQLESDAKRKGDLLKLSRKMKEVDDDMERHNELLTYVKKHWLELDAVVARRRKDFTSDFFHHLELLCQARYDQPEEADELAKFGANCLAAVEAHDKAAEDNMAIDVAQMKFDDILSSPSLDAACNKIDELAKRNELDSTLMLLITKAWAAAKESNMMKDEVKDIMYYLYKVARGNLQRLVPKEVRIIRHVLSFDDPKQRLEALNEAFSPGDELEGKDIDMLYTTPEKLHNWIKIVLDAYYMNKQSTLMESARQLMNPMIISRLQLVKKEIEHQFL